MNLGPSSIKKDNSGYTVVPPEKSLSDQLFDASVQRSHKLRAQLKKAYPYLLKYGDTMRGGPDITIHDIADYVEFCKEIEKEIEVYDD